MIVAPHPTIQEEPISARYLLRFDDVCPTMNWMIWEGIEDVLVQAGIRPIVAVIPDNRDPKLFVGPPDPRFWDRVRSWQARGWAIGLHGCHHRYVNEQRGMIGSAAGSEFAGLGFAEQDSKIERALAIFSRQGVTADAWIAPNHSFDRTTLSVLEHRGLNVIVDGFSLFPHRDDNGMMWVPQQLWDLRRRPFGVWTVCLHHNRWGHERLEAFVRGLDPFRSRITDLGSVLGEYRTRGRNRLDRTFERWATRGRPKADGRTGPATLRPVDMSGSIEGRE